MQRFIPFLRSLNEDEEALAGVAMLLDDFYHENFHASQSPQPDGRAPEEQQRVTPRSASEPGRSARKGQRDRTPGGRNEGRFGNRSEPARERGDAPADRPSTGPGPDAQPGGERSGASRRRRRGGRGRGPSSNTNPAA
jgi:hypothetical protein